MPCTSLRAAPCHAAPIVALVAALLATSALGADKKPAPPAPGPKTAILTPEQLRDCLTRKEKLARDTDAVVQAKTAVAADKAEIERGAAALEEQATTLDRTSEEAVASHNARVIARNGQVDAWKAKATAYNSDAEAVLAAKEAYEKGCANRRYDDRDLTDLQRRK
ncbi:MAG: hypothetical protein ABIQ33_05450 [Caldimonas sp.]